jgi:hypothetical protein
MRLRYDLPVAEYLGARSEVHRQIRRDQSGGNFGFKGVKTAARLGYRKGHISCSGSVSYTFKGYTDRRAEQFTVVALPTLVYEYARVKAKCAWDVHDKWSIWSALSYVKRSTNTTTIDRRTRRDYAAWDAVRGLGCTLK